MSDVSIRTSTTHPITLSWVVQDPTEGGGRLGLCFCPGKKVRRGRVQYDRDLSADLHHLKHHFRVARIVCLLGQAELNTFGLRSFAADVRSTGLDLTTFPIVEMAPPDSLPDTAALVRDIASELAAGRNVAMHCRGGVGRAGTIAACLLLHLHQVSTAADAIALVRLRRCKTAVESYRQEKFVVAFAASLQGAAPPAQPEAPPTPPRQARFMLTGFGPFHKCAANPTEKIVAAVERRGNVSTSWSLTESAVLKVSRAAVERWLAAAAAEVCALDAPPEDPVVWLHLGVATNARCFHLESQAVNEASFRCPDEDGDQPHEVCLDSVLPLGMPLCSDLPVAALAEELLDRYDVAVSNDAGLFVCNSTYYASLQMCREHRQARRWHSLFVHVPLREREEESQADFVLELMEGIARHVLSVK